MEKKLKGSEKDNTLLTDKNCFQAFVPLTSAVKTAITSL